MNNWAGIGILALIISVVVARIVSETALKKLNSEQKVKLLDSFTGMRKYSLVPLVVLLVLYYWLNANYPSWRAVLFILFCLSAGTSILVSHYMVVRKLRQLSMPQEFNKQFHLSRIISYIGLLLLIVSLFISHANS